MDIDFSFFGPYIIPLAFVICLCVGWLIKHVIKNELLNQFIPIILAIVGIIIIVWDTLAFTPVTVAEGLVTGLAATGCYEQVMNILRIGKDAGDE